MARKRNYEWQVDASARPLPYFDMCAAIVVGTWQCLYFSMSTLSLSRAFSEALGDSLNETSANMTSIALYTKDPTHMALITLIVTTALGIMLFVYLQAFQKKEAEQAEADSVSMILLLLPFTSFVHAIAAFLSGAEENERYVIHLELFLVLTST